jgi:tricarballylate dehydrogenase
MKNEKVDIVVVGGGTAAFEAAVAARQSGAESVVMLEKAPEAEFGGNARFSHTGFRFVYSGAEEIREFLPDMDESRFRLMVIPPYTHEQFKQDLLRVTQGRIDAQLADILVQESNAAVRWMLDVGITWEPENPTILNGRHFFKPGLVIHPKGGIRGGLNQLMQWRDLSKRLNIDVRFESRVCALHGNDRGIDGVRVSSEQGEYDLLGDAVILCSGGFQANPELRARYLGANADLIKVRGSKHDTGEVLQMALAMGAKAAGHWQGAHATPIDAQAPDVESSTKANRYSYVYGITVNALGERFYDEGEAQSSYTYAKTGWAVARQPGGIAYQIFDRKSAELLNSNYRDFAQGVEASTLAELAVNLGIDAAVLAATVERFNRAVRAEVPFNPAKLDGKCTEGIQPPKSNWALPIDLPPFKAFPITGGITFTFGGLKVNGEAQVLNGAGLPIRGLYASGDILGLFFHNYPSCSGQTRNAVFSRLAGKHAVQSI